MPSFEFLKKADPEIYEVVRNEIQRQRDELEMIASENFTSLAIMEAMGSVLTNKYSEGYPKKRYYGGNQHIDVSESLAIERAKKLFNAEHANVQPHSGSQANMAAYFALLNIGDKILGVDLACGGHLTHGSPVNFSGKWYNVVTYFVDKETQRFDFDQIRKQALAEKPKLILCGYTAYPRTVDFKAFGEIAQECGALLMADIAHIAGLVASGVHPHPFPHCNIVTTTTHKTLRGPRGGLILCKQDLAEKVDKAIFPGTQGGPLDHVIAAKAVCFHEAMKPEFKEYNKQIVKNAKALAEGLMEHGLDLVSGGTDNHLVLVDLTKKNMTGKEAQELLNSVNIIVNKNMIPYDPKPPWHGSGIRIGTPALTTRGLKESDMKHISGLIVKIIDNPKDEQIKQKVREEVLNICKRFPLYPELG